MKKIISITLSLVFILSAMASLTLFPSAAVQGEWVTSRRGNDYDDPGSYNPASGYYYDPAIGFVTVSPDLGENTTPYTYARTKNPVDLKADNDGYGNSVSLKFTVLEFAYDGGENKDEWIAFTINSQPIATPGTVEYGEGACILLRGHGDGSAQIQPFYVDKEGGKHFGVIQTFGMPMIDVPINEHGQEVYTFAIKYDSKTGYSIGINDGWYTDDYLTELLDRACADGAYIGIHMQTGCVDTKAEFAINEWQGDIPVGDDSAEPEEDLRDIAPISDSATVPINEPAVLWDATLRDFRKVNVSGGTYKLNDNNTFNIKAETFCPYITFNVKPEVSYEAADFPYIAVLTRNCWANNGVVYYCAGENLTASNEYSESWSIDDVSFTNGWSLGLIDFSDYNMDGWYGRINSLRLDFDFMPEDVTDDKYNNFDIGFIGAFRSPEEAMVYAETYLTNIGVDPGYDPYETTEPPQEYPDEITDDPACETEPVYVPDETIEEYWPVETETFTVNMNPEYIWSEIEQIPPIEPGDPSLSGNSMISKLIDLILDSGCRSVVAVPTLMIVAMLGALLFVKKKD